MTKQNSSSFHMIGEDLLGFISQSQAKVEEFYKTNLEHKVEDEKELKTLFWDKKVALKRSPTYDKLKYTSGCRFEEDFQLASRGTTIHRETNTFMHTMFKFFNDHEVRNYFNMNIEEWMKKLSRKATFKFKVKHDGTNIHLHSDGKTIHAFTLGCVDPTVNISKFDNKTFAKLSLDLVTPEMAKILHEHPFHGAIFELVTKYNRIVTDYNIGDEGKLLFICDIGRDGLPRNNLFNFKKTESWPCKVGEYKETRDKIYNIIENDPKKYGEHPEGLVLYAVIGDVEVPIAKAKRKGYLERHKIVSTQSNGDSYRMMVQILYCQGKLDDLENEIANHVEEFQDFITKLSTNIKDPLEDMVENVGDRKKYAMICNEKIPKCFRPTMFSIREKLSGILSDKSVTDFIVEDLLLYKRKKDILTTIEKEHKENGCMWFKNVA
jgi:hypothetical protein